MTNTQKLLWMGQQLTPEAPLYNMALAFTLSGPVEPQRFQNAFQAAIDRCDALRTVFEEVDAEPRQRVLASVRYALVQLDFSEAAHPEREARAWIRARAGRHFDLDAPLVDSALIRLDEAAYIWYLNQHHLITDAWSTALLFRTVSELYEQSASLVRSDEQRPSFRAYVDYERAFGETEQFRKARKYWEARLDAEPVRMYGKAAASANTRSERLTYDLGEERSAMLRTLAANPAFRGLTEHVSLFSIFLTLLFAYLHRVSGQVRLAIGTPSHNRATSAFKHTIGPFIEIFPFSVEVDEGDTFASLNARVRSEAASFLRYAQPGASTPSMTRKLNVILNYINASFGSFLGAPVESEWVHPGHADAHHDLRLQVEDFDGSGRLGLHFDFSCDRFSEAERELARSHFVHLLDGLLADPSQAIGSVRLTSDSEERQLLDEFSRSATAPFPVPYTSIVELFEATCARHADAVAIKKGSSVLTYADLNARANQLARYLLSSGVAPGEAVAICMERSPEVVIAMLAVLKAGAYYVPIDVTCPPERMAFMLDETNASVLLARSTLNAPDRNVIALEADFWSRCGEPSEPLDGSPGRDSVAYVMYTSGSTGRPKGVVVKHGGLAQYVTWAASYYLDDRPHAFPLFTSVAFDLTVTSIFTPLICGGTVVVYAETPDGADFALLTVLEDDEVDVIKLTPSHVAMLHNRPRQDSRIKKLILGGEDLKTSVAAAAVRALGDGVELYNEYGPTEATVGCMIHRFDPEADRYDAVPIGRPSAANRIYVLDEHLRPLPTGVAGEIYIAGPQLARGYLGRSGLTEARFLSSPFHPGERMYKTGDLGRWRPDGTMHYLGRNDDQVKIRGFRIELSEVEAALQAHPRITACAVIPVTSAGYPTGVDEELVHCTRCGLPANYPGTSFDAAGVCNLCRSYDTFAARARAYFRTMDDLRDLFDQAGAGSRGEFDCLMLLSGGKDSTYALYQLVGMGLRVLSFTLDNGYISEQAKANIRRVTAALGVEHVFGTTPAMNAIFVDSLQRHSNVCNGCFKTLYTLSTKLAREKGVPFVVTGLSRGQFFETRLTEELFRDEKLDADAIDDIIIEARKAYHRVNDAVFQHLPVLEFQSDDLFEEVRFVDFYRYCDVELGEMIAFLEEHAPWVRPSDTGRSTNCLINEVGIFVHRAQRGYHNYAFPYSWDVRVGHKSREAAMAELNEEIDPSSVRRILTEIGYPENDVPDGSPELRLAAYYVGSATLSVSELRNHLRQRLPSSMMPSWFLPLEELPLTPHGKLDRAALPDPQTHRPAARPTPPTTLAERLLVRIWSEVLRVDEIGIHDNFFDLGGDSIMAIQISARATEAGLRLPPGLLFRHQTIADLAAAAESATRSDAVTGVVPLSPIQRWFFEQDNNNPHHWNEHRLFELNRSVDLEAVTAAVRQIVAHHDALRLRYRHTPAGWEQYYSDADPDVAIEDVDLRHCDEPEQARTVASIRDGMHAGLNISDGPLLRVALFRVGRGRPDRLLIVIHGLVIDAASWGILLEDLERALDGEVLAPRTASYKVWAERLTGYAQSPGLRARLTMWRATGEDLRRSSLDAPHGPDASPDADLKAEHALSRNGDAPVPDVWSTANATYASESIVTMTFTEQETEFLLREATTDYHAQIDELLLAVLASSVAPSVVGDLRLHVETNGRDRVSDDVDFSRSVGCFTVIYPVSLEPIETVEQALRAVKDRLRPARSRSIEYGLLRYMCSDPDGQHVLEATPQILFRYLGQTDQGLTSSILRAAGPVAHSRGPERRRPYPLELTSYVHQDRLHVCWSFSTTTPLATEVQRMADAYAAALRVLIAGERSSARAALSPSDFPLARLDDQKLDTLTALLRRAGRESES